MLLEDQGDKLGWYKAVGVMNSKRVYRQEREAGEENFLYYHSWGSGQVWRREGAKDEARSTRERIGWWVLLQGRQTGGLRVST